MKKITIIIEEEIEEPKIPNLPSYPMYDDPCVGCSNHPSNGGSGFCHCALPAMRNPMWSVSTYVG